MIDKPHSANRKTTNSDVPIRIFQIGFHRCGTQTLTTFFRMNGLSAVHWDRGKLAPAMEANILAGRPYIAGYERFQYISEMQSLRAREYLTPFKRIDLLYKENPKAVFLLNTRGLNDWIASRSNHHDGKYQEYFRKWLSRTLGGRATVEDVQNFWRNEWLVHLQEVRAFFKKRSRARFIDFNIDRDGPKKLAAALPELELDVSFYGHIGKTTVKK